MRYFDGQYLRSVSDYLLILLFISGLNNLSSQGTEYKVMTFNIRYDNPNDGENSWSKRKSRVADILQWYSPDICAMQEVLHQQLEALKLALPDYQVVGVGRDDGKSVGEFCPIFFNRSRFSLLENNTFWLSEHPSIPGKSWDAALPRIVTWVKLLDNKYNAEIYVFNTHFDHVGTHARSESARLIYQKVSEIVGNKAFIVLGDFNLTPDAEPIVFLTRHYQDAYQATKSKPFGPFSTFNGFQPAEVPDKRIDYIFLPQDVEVQKYGALSHAWGGKFASDHHPVYCEFTHQ